MFNATHKIGFSIYKLVTLVWKSAQVLGNQFFAKTKTQQNAEIYRIEAEYMSEKGHTRRKPPYTRQEST